VLRATVVAIHDQLGLLSPKPLDSSTVGLPVPVQCKYIRWPATA
jgi:hypothetical protein